MGIDQTWLRSRPANQAQADLQTIIARAPKAVITAIKIGETAAFSQNARSMVAKGAASAPARPARQKTLFQLSRVPGVYNPIGMAAIAQPKQKGRKVLIQRKLKASLPA